MASGVRTADLPSAQRVSAVIGGRSGAVVQISINDLAAQVAALLGIG